MNLFKIGIIVALALAPCSRAQPPGAGDFNCFAVLAGKNASADGSVLVAHNEDDSGEQLLNWYVVDREKHRPGERLALRGGGNVEQVPVTCKYLWLELPGMEVSDSFLNENGVMIASDACPSREEREDYTDGGILYELRCLAAQRARSASDAVDLMGGLIERFGYADSGRSYLVADKTEAWVLCAVRGRRWVAARVPDDSVAVIANCFTLDHVDLNDTRNYRGSKDIVTYAVSRGWYDPQKDGEFSFRRAYATPGSRAHPDNIKRQWAALRRLTGKEFAREPDALPFAVAPKPGKISLTDLFAVLSDHYEGTEVDERTAQKKGHLGGICRDDTQYGVVAQLRADMSTELGSLLWVAQYRPCGNVFLPWYSGMTKIPKGLARYHSYTTARERHFSAVNDFRAHWPNHRYWRYVDTAEAIDSDYPANIQARAARKARLQQEILENQADFEAKAGQISNKRKLERVLNAYTKDWLAKEQP